MRFYSVHLKPGAPVEKAVMVKEGFSWPAFFFGPLWLAYKRMWRELAVTIGLLALAGVIGQQVSRQAGGWLVLLVFLLLGFEGNGLYRRSLARRGHDEAGMVSGSGLDEAELRLAKELAA